MDAQSAFADLPPGLRKALLDAFINIGRNFREGRWEPSELNGGKLCEVVHSILRGYVDGHLPAKPSKPKNMVDACYALERADATRFPRSVRIQIPRMMIALYEIRNNRGVGHVGGDVDPNHMDAKVVADMAKWIMAELVRVFHTVDPARATEIVESLTERSVPMVWMVAGKRRVLKPGLSMKDQTLLLLYSVNGPVAEANLCRWAEHSNPSVFRRDVLRRLHRERLLEYDESDGQVHISPSGIAYVEDKLPLDV